MIHRSTPGKTAQTGSSEEKAATGTGAVGVLELVRDFKIRCKATKSKLDPHAELIQCALQEGYTVAGVCRLLKEATHTDVADTTLTRWIKRQGKSQQKKGSRIPHEVSEIELSANTHQNIEPAVTDRRTDKPADSPLANRAPSDRPRGPQPLRPKNFAEFLEMQKPNRR